MSDEIKVLREAAEDFSNYGQIGPRLREQAIAILCRHAAGDMEREGKVESQDHSFAPDIEFFEAAEAGWLRNGKRGIWAIIRNRAVIGFFEHYDAASAYADGRTLIRRIGEPPARISALVIDPTPTALADAESRGWNAALTAVALILADYKDRYNVCGNILQYAADRIEQLRKDTPHG